MAEGPVTSFARNSSRNSVEKAENLKRFSLFRGPVHRFASGALLYFVEPGDLVQLATGTQARLLSEAWRREAVTYLVDSPRQTFGESRTLIQLSA
jgi:hypothetical protein